MSWRRFQMLLRGLSPNAALVARLEATRGRARNNVVAITTTEGAQRAFEAIFGIDPDEKKKPN